MQLATQTNTVHYDWGLDLSGTMQGAGGVGGLLREHTYDGPTVNTYRLTYDANGNVGQLVSDAGTTVACYEYDAFGGLIRVKGNSGSSNRIRFSTKYFDNETALASYGHRYYSPSYGRWASRDPIGEGGGLNILQFSKNRSIDRIDYLGLKVTFGTDVGGSITSWTPDKNQKDEFFKNLERLKCAGKLGNALFKLVTSDDFELRVFNRPGIPSEGGGNYPPLIATPNGFKPSVVIPGDLFSQIYLDFNSSQHYGSSVDGIPLAERSPSSSVTIGHELGHAILGLSDPGNVIFLENVLRGCEGHIPRYVYRGKPLSVSELNWESSLLLVEIFLQDPLKYRERILSVIPKWTELVPPGSELTPEQVYQKLSQLAKDLEDEK